MDALRLETLSLSKTVEPKDRKDAERVAADFEALFVRQLVSCMRQTAKFDDAGGMFGSETGSDTYSDWFDQNMAESIGKSEKVGIKQRILADMERWGQLDQKEALQKVLKHAELATRAASAAQLSAASALPGGIDVAG